MRVSVQKPGSPEDILEHFGKKGMKWGVRNKSEVSSNGKVSAKKPPMSKKKKIAIGIAGAAVIVGAVFVGYKLNSNRKLKLSMLRNEQNLLDSERDASLRRFMQKTLSKPMPHSHIKLNQDIKRLHDARYLKPRERTAFEKAMDGKQAAMLLRSRSMGAAKKSGVKSRIDPIIAKQLKELKAGLNDPANPPAVKEEIKGFIAMLESIT